MTCPSCGLYVPPDPETGYDADELCPECRARAARAEQTSRMIRHRYWCANGYEVAIVAKEGEAQDWTAYIGATHGVQTTKETVEFVLRYGCKIDQHIAEVIFPVFKELKLRWRE